MGKLVRDRIPAIMRAAGREPRTRVLGRSEYIRSLLDKLVEEAQELKSAAPQSRMEEAADVYEVLLAITTATGTTMEAVQAEADRKRAERGGFSERIWLEGC
jgi:predicted house-cleaning noncanonical NTP pyrophosphatase (MazG superfamily)